MASCSCAFIGRFRLTFFGGIALVLSASNVSATDAADVERPDGGLFVGALRRDGRASGQHGRQQQKAEESVGHTVTVPLL